MVDTITLSNNEVYVSGRAKAPDPNLERVQVTARLDFTSAASYTLDFTVINQLLVVGIIRGMFMDNTDNPNEVIVSVSGTQQRFTIPAFAEGVFPITAAENSRIVMESDGGASESATATFYNYEQDLSVWYKYGMDPNSGVINAEGTQPIGTDMVAAPNNNPVFVAGWDAGNDLRPLRTDATGALQVVNNNTKLAPQYVNTGPDYERVAASQTNQVLGATGALGDILTGLLVVPNTTSPGAISIGDGIAPATVVFTGGATSVSNLVPFFIPLGVKSVTGSWRVTTGADVSVIAVGAFT